MSDEPEIAAGAVHGPDPDSLRDAAGNLSEAWLGRLRSLLDAGEADEVTGLVSPLHSSDVGDILEALRDEHRIALVRMLGDHFDFSALTEVDDAIRSEIVEALSNEDIARGVAALDTDDAVYILEDLDEPDREAVLAHLPAFERLTLKRSLDFPEESAGRRMQIEFIAIPPFWTVGQTIDYLRGEENLPDEFFQLYVVDPAYNLLGTIALDKFLRAKRFVRIEDLMNRNLITVEATEDQEEAARKFERYDLVEVGVVDDDGRLVGVLTIDDIVDVIHEEATEDIKALGGVGDEELSDNAIRTVRSRSSWLLVSLVSTLLASVVIGLFDGTIEHMVALAVLMPIVAAMGGNAGTQTMTVTVRALATRELDPARVHRLIARELLVGFMNGIIFALLVGLVTAVRFSNFSLGVVIGLAMIVNMVVAGGAGIFIPLLLNRLRVDPAIASGPFVTTITDVIGFFVFLGLAGLWFGLF